MPGLVLNVSHMWSHSMLSEPCKHSLRPGHARVPSPASFPLTLHSAQLLPPRNCLFWYITHPLLCLRCLSFFQIYPLLPLVSQQIPVGTRGTHIPPFKSRGYRVCTEHSLLLGPEVAPLKHLCAHSPRRGSKETHCWVGWQCCASGGSCGDPRGNPFHAVCPQSWAGPAPGRANRTYACGSAGSPRNSRVAPWA